MATRTKRTTDDAGLDPDLAGLEYVRFISRAEGTALLDHQARKLLGMSGHEFSQRYRAGTIEDPDRSEVHIRSTLLLMAED